MWPPEVERIAALLRAAGVEGRLEQLSLSETSPPGPAVRADAFRCDGRMVVALVPEEREIDLAKLRAATRSAEVRRGAAATFPYADARVVADRLVFAEPTVWLEAGSPGYVVSLSTSQLVEITKAVVADVVAEA